MSMISEVILAAACSILGWSALRLVGMVDKVEQGQGRIRARLIRLEAKINNGLTHGVEGLVSDVAQLHTLIGQLHASVQRDQHARTRLADKGVDDAT